jgi:MEMO1 family protein
VLLDREFIEYMSIPQVEESHRYEHSGEVILPFLQLFLSGNFRIVPVSMLNQDPEQALLLAEKITEAAGRLGRRILVLASSDFSHFVSPEHGAATDRKVIDTILTMDADAVFNVVQKTRASVCGYGPIMT